jgi:hypothetical protein
MNFELEYLWNICLALSSTEAASGCETEQESDITAEIKRLQSILLYFSPQKETSIQDFIRFHQSCICRMVQAIELTLQPGKPLDRSAKMILNRLLEGLDELLDFILTYYPLEFDYTLNISSAWISRLKIIQEKKVNPIFAKLEKIGLHPGLTKILFEALTLSDRPRLSYGDFRYISHLTRELNRKIETLITEEALKSILTQQDFNHLDYYEYLRRDLSNEFDTSMVISEKYKLLIIRKKELDQRGWNTNGRYSPEQPSLSQMIDNHLESERLFIKELDFLTTELINSGLLDANYKVSFTVKQLAFYIYLNVECGIITEQRVNKIHQYAIAHVDSYEKTGISEKSLKNAYYLHSAEDIRKVCDKVAKMLAIAQEKY